ncbi:hypothetical protein ACQKM2_30915 [Streptomyces sp. NPDC004126]|uniref:hypothetical protein n=1 Tax=Streptomyces sp. NPDC004126 TaxID=3390695 RepID=UPI003CFEAA42
MADHIPINPCTIPQFTGDLDSLEQDRTAIAAAASTLRDTGANVDNTFQGLASFYSSPEAAQLFATTNRVQTESDYFADQLEVAAQALGEFATEARPIVARLKQLQAQATAFTNTIQGDAHWKDDGKKTDENNDLIHDVNAAAEAFWAAERTCASKIRALYGRPALTVDDGTHADGMHGYRAADLNKVQDLPWGSQLQQSHRWYDVGHWAKSFIWDGLIMDGIVGTVHGLGTLVGWDGSAAAGQAWTGLAKLATGIAISSSPGTAFVFWNADDKAMPAWIRDSRNTMKETGKALVAWDEWGKNPARAAGAVTFNALTTIFSGGVGTGVKTGGIAKTISIAGKAGRLIDPMTYVGQAAGKAASLTFSKLKIGELLSNLGKTADGTFPKVDDVTWTNLPKADAPGVTFPHPNDTARLPDDALGRPQYLDKITGQLLDHNGLPKQHLTAIPKGADHPLAEVPTRQEATVGAPGGGRPHPPGSTADNMPHNSHTEPGGGGTGSHSNTDTTPTGGGHTDTPSMGGHGDGSGGVHVDSPTVPHQGDGLRGGQAHPTGAAGDNAPGPAGWERARGSGPLELGGKLEQQFREQVRGLSTKQGDVPAILETLANNAAGREVAETVASGRFRDSEGFGRVISNLSRPEDASGCIEQIRLANRLYDDGFTDISFEIKDGHQIKPGVFTGPATDLDVMVREANGRIHGWQFKDMTGPKSPVEPLKIRRNILKSMGQLLDSNADIQTLIAEVKAPKAEMLEQIDEFKQRFESKRVQFVIRTPDGIIFVPHDGHFTPEVRP